MMCNNRAQCNNTTPIVSNRTTCTRHLPKKMRCITRNTQHINT